MIRSPLLSDLNLLVTLKYHGVAPAALVETAKEGRKGYCKLRLSAECRFARRHETHFPSHSYETRKV